MIDGKLSTSSQTSLSYSRFAFFLLDRLRSVCSSQRSHLLIERFRVPRATNFLHMCYWCTRLHTMRYRLFKYRLSVFEIRPNESSHERRGLTVQTDPQFSQWALLTRVVSSLLWYSLSKRKPSNGAFTPHALQNNQQSKATVSSNWFWMDFYSESWNRKSVRVRKWISD